MSIAAVQARVVELQSAITAVARSAEPAAPSASSGSAFEASLADAVAGQAALAALGGGDGGAAGSTTFGAPTAGGVGAAWAGQLGAAGGGLFGPLAGSVATGLFGPGAGAAAAGMLVGVGAPAGTSALAGVGALGGALGATGVPGAVGGLTPSGASGSPAPGSGAALVESARKYLGVPYVWGGESLAEGGLDCSGLVQLAMKDIGVDVPRVVRQQMTIGTEVPSLAQALPGDLVVTRGGGHIGIYVGDNKWIHAPYPGEKVKLAEMTATPTTIRRVLPPW